MAYVKNIWVDQDVERPKTYEVTNNQDGSITLTDSFGLVTELGTPVNEVNMNHIEDGIDGCAIRKHNLTETFNLGEWVLGGTGDDEGIYKSIIANNVGNALTDSNSWEKVKMGGSSRNVGEIITSTLPLTDAGLHLLDGSLISNGIYSAFVDYIAGLVSTYPDLFTTESAWQTAVSTYGVCGKFVYDSTLNTVRLPKVTGIIEGTTDATALGDLVEAGLPNITGGYKHPGWQGYDYYGAVYSGQTVRNFAGSDAGGTTTNGFLFNASRSNPIYGKSSTVQPQTIKAFYYIVIATSTKTDIQVDIDEIATDLNGKADTDLTNVTDMAKITMARASMPSSPYIDLTLGASGASYIAPADGYVKIGKTATASNQYLSLAQTGYTAITYSTNTGNALWNTIPVAKGTTFYVSYSAAGETRMFRFYYAVGSESEAS